MNRLKLEQLSQCSVDIIEFMIQLTWLLKNTVTSNLKVENRLLLTLVTNNLLTKFHSIQNYAQEEVRKKKNNKLCTYVIIGSNGPTYRGIDCVVTVHFLFEWMR